MSSTDAKRGAEEIAKSLVYTWNAVGYSNKKDALNDLVINMTNRLTQYADVRVKEAEQYIKDNLDSSENRN